MDQQPNEVLVPLAGPGKAAAWFFENSLDGAFLGIEAGVLGKANATWTALTGWTPAQTEVSRSFLVAGPSR